MGTTRLATTKIRRVAMGPKSPAGKSRALAARLRGKLPHSVAIVPGVETEQEWEEFRLAIVEGYSPEGALEVELADRVAHLLWRLRRFSRYEADRASWRMKCASVEYLRFRSELTEGVRDLDVPDLLPRRPLDQPYYRGGPAEVLCDALWYASPEAVTTPDSEEHESGASNFVWAVAVAANQTGYKVIDKGGWTVGMVRSHISDIAELSGTSVRELLAAVAAKAKREEAERAARVAAEQATYDAALGEFKRTLTLPTEGEIRNAARWESHLERSLCRMMDRLERLQRMRLGEYVAPPALLNVALDKPE